MRALDHKFEKPLNNLPVIDNSSNIPYDYDKFLIGSELNSRRAFLSLFNFNQIPPIIGIILSNKAGISILTYEYDGNSRNRFGPIEKYLNQDQDDLSDFISMYLSSLIGFAENVKIENLRHVGIGGTNIKIKIFFQDKNYMIIVFLNANTDLSLRIQDYILDHFSEVFEKYDWVFENYNDKKSIQIRKNLESIGQTWLKTLNRSYINTYEKLYLAKEVKIEKFMASIKPIINHTVESYMQYVPDEIKTDICREIHEKVNNKLSEYY